MGDILQINNGSNVQLVSRDSCTASCHCEIGTSSATVVDVPASHSAEPYIIGCIAIVIAILVGYLLRKRLIQLNREITGLNKRLDKYGEQLFSLKENTSSFDAATEDLSTNVMKETDSRPCRDDGSACNLKEGEDSVLTIRYATLQAPDENGILKFSERTMVESPSPDKMFALKLDFNKGIGAYGINPDAIPLILYDLQIFREYVKPFSFNGDVRNAIIEDKNLGRITRRDSCWVVVEPLEISIHN